MGKIERRFEQLGHELSAYKEQRDAESKSAAKKLL